MDKATALDLLTKHLARHFSVEDKQHILNIFNTYGHENPQKTKTQKVQFTATSAGVTTCSVYKILHEHTDMHEFHPLKRYHRQRVILDNIDDTKNALKCLIHSFFDKNEPPMLNKILAVIHENDIIPHFKRNSLWKLMKKIGFRSSNNILKEKQEIIVLCRRFLREIRKHREEDRKLYYLYETWVNADHTVNKVWKDTSIITQRQAFIEGLMTGLKNLSGK